MHIALVLDACTDRTAEIAAAAAGATTTVLTVAHRNVGAARAAGCAALLDLGCDWLASTDADSVVGPDWLRAQLRYAAAGYDAVAGTVVVEDWGRHPAALRERFLGHYADRWGHQHVHGANLGVSAAAYRAVSGFPPVTEHEDVLLVDALVRAGRRIAWAADVPVRTSARTLGRTPGGLSGFLDALGDPVSS